MKENHTSVRPFHSVTQTHESSSASFWHSKIMTSSQCKTLKMYTSSHKVLNNFGDETELETHRQLLAIKRYRDSISRENSNDARASIAKLFSGSKDSFSRQCKTRNVRGWSGNQEQESANRSERMRRRCCWRIYATWNAITSQQI